MMIMLNLIFCIFMYVSGLVMYSMKRKHLLLMLLSLEFIVLSLYMMIFFYLSLYDFEYFFSLMFLTFSVCEGVLGLSLMVLLIRTHGNDYFQVLSVL
uniref:NADH-ubiquinone oxidoreductase chain 4L n=2 Tax=Contacyphon TaxID=1569076 RepID=B6D8U0_9COLE|nr:NADH dehydrogenase subunit 4L [Contacyphon sp. BT0012]ACF35078.1 NADH dehydrogenase subunit 4L [Contacyphon sp. BT0012]ANJ70375.1 NADH dehydrogenase subunit 4L [Contacyphon variabilis]